MAKIIDFSPVLREQDGLGKIPRPSTGFGLFGMNRSHVDDMNRSIVAARALITGAL